MDYFLGFSIPVVIVAILFIGLPWLILHYVTRWKTQASLTQEDENLLGELYELGRKLDDRIGTIERILSADNPGWRSQGIDQTILGVEDEVSAKRRMK